MTKQGRDEGVFLSVFSAVLLLRFYICWVTVYILIIQAANYAVSQVRSLYLQPSGGNVGIGVTGTTLNEQLEVNGNVKIAVGNSIMLGNIRIGANSSNPTGDEWKYKGCLNLNINDGKFRFPDLMDYRMILNYGLS